MKRFFACVFLFISIAMCCGFACKTADVAYASTPFDGDGFYDRLTELFLPEQSSEQICAEEVYLGGYPIGITIDGTGVTVVGLNEFIGEDGKVCCPALDAGLAINDTITELDGKKIYNSSRLAEIAAASEGKPIEVKFVRNGETLQTKIAPQKELNSARYRLGLWTHDASGGIGTLTYTKKNLNFGSLGHPICDNNGNIVQCSNGGVYRCVINGVTKGQRGAAGELKGSFSYDDRLGSLYLNNKFGAFGKFFSLPSFCRDLVPVAAISEVTPGKAEIFCTVEGDVRKSYSIEIVKVTKQTVKDDKGMVIHVTDPELLEKTGGIVQGMSGSPIMQNGKLVGAVTHVFVNDPTRGYGVFAQWMLTN